MERFVAGIDGGATKTLCLISDIEGRVLGLGSSGPSNYHNVGLRKASEALQEAVRKAVKGADMGRRKPDVACFGLAALESPRDFRIVRRAINSLGLAKKNIVVHDSVIALMGAFCGEPGIIVIAGTGCVAAGIDASRNLIRVGGWGYVIDDEGSAYDIGRKALRAALRFHDGRGPPTLLMDKLLRRLGASSPEGLIDAVYIKGMSVADIASLCHIVVEAAKEGDEVSRAILADAGNALGELAVAAANKLAMLGESFKVAPIGGVFRSGEFVMKPFTETLRRSAPLAQPVSPRLPPAAGALIIALREARTEIDDHVISRIEETIKSIGIEKLEPSDLPWGRRGNQCSSIHAP